MRGNREIEAKNFEAWSSKKGLFLLLKDKRTNSWGGILRVKKKKKRDDDVISENSTLPTDLFLQACVKLSHWLCWKIVSICVCTSTLSQEVYASDFILILSMTLRLCCNQQHIKTQTEKSLRMIHLTLFSSNKNDGQCSLWVFWSE